MQFLKMFLETLHNCLSTRNYMGIAHQSTWEGSRVTVAPTLSGNPVPATTPCPRSAASRLRGSYDA